MDVQLDGKIFDGNTVTLTALLDGSVRKIYAVTLYDGGFRNRSVRLLDAPAARLPVGVLPLTASGWLRLPLSRARSFVSGAPASGGRLLAVARSPAPLTGAKNALQNCDLSSLDGDGNRELTAGFSFPDGSTASLVWFYSDSGLVYIEAFSRLPGEAPAARTEKAC